MHSIPVSILALFSFLVWGPSAQAQTHVAWTEILSSYVVESDDGINRFDYSALKNSPDALKKLDTYIEALANGDLFDSDIQDERFAAWANLYNALTIQVVIKHYPVKSIRDIGKNPFSPGPWKSKLVTVNGKKMSLNDIEHGVLRAKWSDPRVHYAVNCASLGCPNLQKKAWEAETLNQELDQAAKEFINHPRGVVVLADGRLRISSIYNWFKKDFGGSQVGAIMHFAKYATPELAANITAETMIKSYQYDWSLNDLKGINDHE